MRRRGYRPRDKRVVSAVMSTIRSKDNVAERALRRALWHLGLRYRLYSSRLAGTPDIVFASAETAVFVDGDFWHGRVFLERGEAALRSMFKRRTAWWVAKIKRNVLRDREVTRCLRADGWTVIRVWEKDILGDVGGSAARIARMVRQRRMRLTGART